MKFFTAFLDYAQRAQRDTFSQCPVASMCWQSPIQTQTQNGCHATNKQVQFDSSAIHYMEQLLDDMTEVTQTKQNHLAVVAV